MTWQLELELELETTNSLNATQRNVTYQMSRDGTQLTVKDEENASMNQSRHGTSKSKAN